MVSVTRILKCCSPIVDEYIAIAFNKCILEKTYPTCFKVAKVIPLHKKGDKSDPANYRPISLLSSLGKLFEKLLHKRMVKFCEKEKILTSTQYGFRSKRSCVDAISTVTEYISLKLIEKVLDKFVSLTYRKLSTRWIIIFCWIKLKSTVSEDLSITLWKAISIIVGSLWHLIVLYHLSEEFVQVYLRVPF